MEEFLLLHSGPITLWYTTRYGRQALFLFCFVSFLLCRFHEVFQKFGKMRTWQLPTPPPPRLPPPSHRKHTHISAMGESWIRPVLWSVFTLPGTDTDTNTDTGAIRLQTNFLGVVVDVGVGQCEHSIKPQHSEE